MAKSFHTILVEGKLEVDHKGQTVVLELPSWLGEAKDVLMDEAKLKEWAEKNEVMHGLLHAGIQKTIIDMRAKARPGTNAKTGESKSILDDQEGAQKRLDEFKVTPTPPPGQGGKGKAFGKGEESALTAAIEALKMAGIADEQVVLILGAKFALEKVRRVLDGLGREAVKSQGSRELEQPSGGLEQR